MPRTMPRLDIALASEVRRAVQLAQAGENIRASSPPGSLARNELSIPRLGALYEAAYFRMFLAWETFLEQTFLRYLCGHASGLGTCTLIYPSFSTLADAETAVLRGSDFVSWANPIKVVRRSREFMTAGFHESVLLSDQPRLIHFQSIRDRIAHPSRFARDRFDQATRQLALRRYPGSSPGSFLRDRATLIPFPKTWLEEIADEFASLAHQICA
jgi:hypothetical protein